MIFSSSKVTQIGGVKDDVNLVMIEVVGLSIVEELGVVLREEEKLVLCSCLV